VQAINFSETSIDVCRNTKHLSYDDSHGHCWMDASSSSKQVAGAPRFRSLSRTNICLWVPTELDTKNDCACEDQQQFPELEWTETSEPTAYIQQGVRVRGYKYLVAMLAAAT
jgi:hypothetical protein